MNIRDEDRVSAVALVMESEADTAAPVAEGSPNGEGPEEGPPVVEGPEAEADAEADGEDVEARTPPRSRTASVGSATLD